MTRWENRLIREGCCDMFVGPHPQKSDIKVSWMKKGQKGPGLKQEILFVWGPERRSQVELRDSKEKVKMENSQSLEASGQ